MTPRNLGMTHLDHVHFAVTDLEASVAFYTQRFGFTPRWRSSAAAVQRTGQKSAVLQVGRNSLQLSQPVAEFSDAGRFLKCHPEGVMALGFGVTDIHHAFNTLLKRGGTPMDDVRAADGILHFDLATPVGDVLFRFVQRAPGAAFDVGFEPWSAPTMNVAPWVEVDHVTSNARTMKPLTDWYQNVMGMTRFWDVEFHTTQTPEGARKDSGTGLMSIVMWDEESGIKFATNEPLRPFFRQSQIERFVLDNRGPGVQHVALTVPSIIEAVDGLKARGFEFLPAPAAYYGRLETRMLSVGWDLAKVREPIAELQKRNILLDASKEGYMLQIFQQELGTVQGQKGAVGSPAFFEVIQRAGDRGFGYGNFRALFEAIESSQAGRKD